MELTKSETKTLILACSVAIEKECAALPGLELEVRESGIRRAIDERTRNISDLNKIRKRLTTEN